MASGNNGCLVSKNAALPRASHLPTVGRAFLLAQVHEHFLFKGAKMNAEV